MIIFFRPLVNGVALANRDKTVFCLGSDGSQQEGNDAEAARLAVAQGLNVKLIIDDNDVTIAGHPSEYLKGYDVTKTLEGHGLKVITVQGEDLDALWGGISEIVNHKGPAAGKHLPRFSFIFLLLFVSFISAWIFSDGHFFLRTLFT